MLRFMKAGAFVLTALVVSSVVAGDALKSGPQVGGKSATPNPFNPLHCNGPDADQKVCLV